MEKVAITLMLVFFGVDACMNPPLAANYTNAAYSGEWYEIGKIQTPGGAAFQKDCICTLTRLTSDYPVWGDAKVTYECRMYVPENTYINSTNGVLLAKQTPGNFEQRFNLLIPGADYNVIWLDEDAAMEYDCFAKPSGVEEYCVHIMSRTPTMDPTKLQAMLDYAEGLGLNPQNIEYVSVPQEGCW